ncbi:unnamed protein product [Protopolystoma xenopodis]|uniref:Uncharacterized protein n=1 Tax=Protopolystoma xenopodis TaxID=117903 RepID=A0A448WVC1_9PLAT|nr:unnamed protein product [Protopolystoma xenopodis]
MPQISEANLLNIDHASESLHAEKSSKSSPGQQNTTEAFGSLTQDSGTIDKGPETEPEPFQCQELAFHLISPVNVVTALRRFTKERMTGVAGGSGGGRGGGLKMSLYKHAQMAHEPHELEVPSTMATPSSSSMPRGKVSEVAVTRTSGNQSVRQSRIRSMENSSNSTAELVNEESIVTANSQTSSQGSKGQ